MPVFVIEFDDEPARWRHREAVFLSIIFHLLLFIVILLAPKYLPSHMVAALSPRQILQDRELTFLEAPPDRQKPPEKPPQTNIASDKDRIATSRKPTIDKKTLDELADARRPGLPEPPGAKLSPQLPIPPQISEEPQPGGRPQPPANQLARLEPPPVANPGKIFGGAMSAGGAINEAARAAAAAKAGGGGAAGDFGSGRFRANSPVGSDLDIMSDTMGVDFGPYLSRVLASVRENWYNLIPEAARPPLMKRGKVSIEFAILKDGKVAGMRLAGSSGDVALDRAAWGGITGSNPFPPLPAEFGGPYLALRFRFYYNPERGEVR